MQFRIRPGFTLFRTRDEAIDYQSTGPISGARPRAQGGDVVSLNAKELGEILCKHELAKLEPVDPEAMTIYARYGNPEPIVSRVISHPYLFVRPKENANAR